MVNQREVLGWGSNTETVRYSLDEDEDGEAHSAADEARHWPQQVQHIRQEP